MAQLAIKGHSTRGSEVIALLEMLGGKNINNYNGTFNECYTIDNDKICTIYTSVAKIDDFVIFTLEEFLEKYPYKVGDKVTLDKFPCEIKGMSWEYDDIIYYVKGVDFTKGAYSKDLQPYKEETMKTITIDDFKANTKEWLIDKLHGMIISDAVKTIGNIHDELHKPKYPKTYEECCDVLSLGEDGKLYTKGYKASLIQDFQKLLICRDAYWKIAGDEYHLGKSWEPNWRNNYLTKWIISFYQGRIDLTKALNVNFVLAFPEEEMRDAFYENFKELIETVKELL